jgi:hypothetical protein
MPRTFFLGGGNLTGLMETNAPNIVRINVIQSSGWFNVPCTNVVSARGRFDYLRKRNEKRVEE